MHSSFSNHSVSITIPATTFFLTSQFVLFGIATTDEKQSSMVIIFSCWKTMIGTAVAALPWTFQQSGIVLGVILSFTSFLISFYTCKLIIDMAGTDPDYSDTLKKFYGKSNLSLMDTSNFSFNYFQANLDSMLALSLLQFLSWALWLVSLLR